MGAGKTEVGRALSATLGYSFIDMDRIIEEREGISIKDIFDRYGEEYFRKKERDILIELSTKKKGIISTGGGCPCFFNNLDIMKETGFVVYLKNSIDTILKRLNKDDEKEKRPLLRERDESWVIDLINKREPCYSKAHKTILCDDKNIEEISKEIVKEYNIWKKRSLK